VSGFTEHSGQTRQRDQHSSLRLSDGTERVFDLFDAEGDALKSFGVTRSE
jgi:hypothetical protein